MNHMSRKITIKLQDKIENGELTAEYVLNIALNYLGEAEVAEMVELNNLFGEY